MIMLTEALKGFGYLLILFIFCLLSVPEYEVVSIRSLTKRSLDEKRLVSFNAFGQDLRLSLKKNPHIVKQSLRMWIAEPDPSKGIHYQELPQVREQLILKLQLWKIL